MAQPTQEIGAPGLAEFAGRIRQDFLTELRGKQAFKRYEEMRLNSPIVGAMLLAIEQAIRSVSWMYESEEGEEDPRIEFLEESQKAMSHSWNDHLSEALTMLPFGFSLFEIVYQRVNGRLYWRKFGFRGQDTVLNWQMDDHGGLEGMVQQPPPRYNTIEIPIEKLLLYRTRVERNNPEGRSILRTAWVPYYYAKHIQQVEAIGIERDLAGLPVIHMPDTADPTETDSDNTDYGRARRLVSNIRNDEQAGVVLQPGWELDLLSTGGQRQFDTDKIVRRYESRMLMSALAQFLMLGQENVGSFALSKDQTDFFTMSVNATADIIAETFTKFAIPRLLKLNGLEPEGVSLSHTPAGDVDIMVLADFLQKTGAKISWTTEDEMWLRKTAGLPESDPDTIEAERERRSSIADSIRSRFEPDDEDDMGVTLYAAGNAPDDDERIRSERRWQRALTSYLSDLKDRVMDGARGLSA